MRDDDRRTDEPPTVEATEPPEGWIPISVNNVPCRVPEDVETVGDLRRALELTDSRTELVRLVHAGEWGDGRERLGVQKLGAWDDPVVVSEDDEFFTREEPDDDRYPHTLPREVVAFDDDLFKRICNHLGEVGKLDRPNRTTELDLRIRAGELVRVTHAAEDDEDEDVEWSTDEPEKVGFGLSKVED